MVMNHDERNHYTQPVKTILLEDCEALIQISLLEDAPDGDPTSESVFLRSDNSKAKIISREEGIVCGLVLLPFILEIYARDFGGKVSFSSETEDGDRFSKGDCLGVLVGATVDVLRLERLVLNFIQYLSDISTTVASVVLLAGPEVSILDTRKTLPGYRKLAKYAVYCGGGTNHRIHLSDMAMIKDNHVKAASGIVEAVELIRQRHPKLPLNVEVDTIDQLKQVLPLSVDVVLLDNMRGGVLKEAVSLIRAVKNHPVIEVSGGWKPDELHLLKGLGPLGVSMGFLTHTTHFLDISLDVI